MYDDKWKIIVFAFLYLVITLVIAVIILVTHGVVFDSIK